QEIEVQSQQPFTLANGPLLRLKLLLLAEQEYVLILTVHHIVTDGWSMNILIKELAALYLAYREKKSSLLPALPIQYADFAAWQRAWLKEDVLDEMVDYWCQQLSGTL